MEKVTHEDLMRYIDGEMSPEERQRVEAALARSTELQRDAAVYRSLRDDLQRLSFPAGTRRSSVWNDVHRRLTRPLGWVLLVGGALVWTAYGAWLFATSSTALLEKLATGAVVIGVLLLLTTVIYERYREWLIDPYRDVHR